MKPGADSTASASGTLLRLPAAATDWAGLPAADLLEALTPIVAGHPLLAAVADHGGHIDPASVRLSLLGRDAAGRALRLGVFGEEIVGGCSCGDEPFTARFYLELTLHMDAVAGTAELRAATD
ncbi:hypothetical protein [uncultured Thiohalocapsa sp.]|uniref:hypothetical protein n=1 Tax=uncultured Thiohalocapsa sp. TaxID=768990 RepID=UPI0025E68A55|nr:hypothetical protein [uncultured Thiohalocapsa sp.]